MNIKSYKASPIYQDNSLADFELFSGGRGFRLLGRFRDKFFQSVKATLKQNPGCLPVLLGSGTREYLEFVLDTYPGPVAIVDKEEELIQAVGTRQIIDPHKNRILFVNSDSVHDVLARLTTWQAENQDSPFLPIVIPSYLRLDQEYYKTIIQNLKASKKYDFWAKAKYSRFQNEKPRILLITTNYFLMGEIIAACRRQDIAHHFLNLGNQELGTEEFVRDFLQAVIEFKPDFVFTINHLGLDREGVLIDLLARMELPLASWFVDNPHLILYLYENLKSPLCSIFTWDSDNIQSLKSLGFEKVFYLPLATDSHRFSTGKSLPGFGFEARDVSFVGNSMVHKVAIRLEKVRAADKSGLLVKNYKKVARSFVSSSQSLVYPLLEQDFPELIASFESLPSIESKLDFETLVTWEATRIYRKQCVEAILPFKPLIAGDDGWKETFRPGKDWDYHPELNYYADLPGFYPHARVNFNTTSAQMKGAVNQRVFDVPACGGFLITDYRKQIENLLEPGTEVVYYRDQEEIGELITYYLNHGNERRKISELARKRILAEHTYDHRLLELCLAMKRIYG
ncbi:MAG: glycosyltransferase [Desulfonatronovibrio sp.]